VEGDGLKWVAASGARGLTGVSITLAKNGAPERLYTVRLHFLEPDGNAAGKRVFDVAIQGQTVLQGLDVAREAGGPKRPLVKEFTGIKAGDVLKLVLKPSSGGASVLCGIEVVAEA
jgi:hypothetical protein